MFLSVCYKVSRENPSRDLQIEINLARDIISLPTVDVSLKSAWRRLRKSDCNVPTPFSVRLFQNGLPSS